MDYKSFNLLNTLKKYGISTEKWGTETYKSISHLQKEIDDKESFLKEVDGNLVRYIEVVGINVYYNDKYLIEDKQVFDDGRTRKRKMESSVSEKMISGEDPFNSAIRGLEEELDIKVNPNNLKKVEEKSIPSDSHSYPGLKCVYQKYIFDYELSEDQFKEEYIEHQDDKRTYFKWISK